MRTAFNRGLVSAEDYLRIQSLQRVRGKCLPVGRRLNEKEIKKLLTCQSSKSLMSIRDGAALALMLSTGVRCAERVLRVVHHMI